MDIDGRVQLFNGRSLPQILAQAYPEYKWETFRFGRNSSQYWGDLFRGGLKIDFLFTFAR
jgi:hypothetical protein